MSTKIHSIFRRSSPFPHSFQRPWLEDMASHDLHILCWCLTTSNRKVIHTWSMASSNTRSSLLKHNEIDGLGRVRKYWSTVANFMLLASGKPQGERPQLKVTSPQPATEYKGMQLDWAALWYWRLYRDGFCLSGFSWSGTWLPSGWLDMTAATRARQCSYNSIHWMTCLA